MTSHVRWAWPADGPAPLSLIGADADATGRRVAVLAGVPSGATPARPDVRPGSLYVLDGATGDEKFRWRGSPVIMNALAVAGLDSGGLPTIVAADTGRSFIALDGQGQAVWSSGSPGAFGPIDVVDLDKDGVSEVVSSYGITSTAPNDLQIALNSTWAILGVLVWFLERFPGPPEGRPGTGRNDP